MDLLVVKGDLLGVEKMDLLMVEGDLLGLEVMDLLMVEGDLPRVQVCLLKVHLLRVVDGVS